MSRVLLLPSSDLGPYQRKRATNLVELGPALQLERWLRERGLERGPSAPHERIEKEWVAFHPWKPGWLPVTHDEAATIRGGASIASFAQQGWEDNGPPDLRRICVRALFDFGALQNPWELERLVAHIAERPPRIIIEIGTYSGGLLFALAQVAQPDATLISIDTPDARDSVMLRHAIPSILAGLVRPTQTFHAIRESSTVYSVLEDVRRILDGRAVDLLVIDGDHSYGVVRSDFAMYSPLVGSGGLIALHDVACSAENTARGIDVSVFWREIAERHGAEVILDENGIPGLRLQPGRHERKPAALGWGLVPAR